MDVRPEPKKAVKNEKELKKSWAIAIVWDLLSLTAAFAIAVIGRAYLLPVILGENGAASSESVFIEMIRKVFTSELALPFIGGLFLCGILPMTWHFRLSEEFSCVVFWRRLCLQRIPSFW